MKDKAPAPIVRKTARGLSPVDAFDADRIIADAPGTEYDLVKRVRRSFPQHKLYWAMLDRVVKATGKWPTAEHLHANLKLLCGFSYPLVNWDTGEVAVAVDSIAFDKMDQAQFQIYFDAAVEKLSEHLGFDPLEFMGVAA